MYPTWPKGEKGKTPDELASEVVSTAGFLTYPNGIVINGKRYFGYTIQKGDIITAKNDAILKTTSEVYSTPSGVLKRVVALGGDTVELKDGIFYLNDQPQKEQYIAESRSTYGEDFLRECQLYKVPNDSVFLMGDNRKGSGDSREFGPVKYSEIQSVLPLKKQVGTLDKNWHDASNDLADTAKPTIDIDKFVDLLNQKRKENGASPVKHDPKLDASAKIRGEALLKQNTIHTQASYNEVVSAMSKVGYWNSYVWEWSIEGYYNADELIEDYIERDSSDAKDVWFDKKFDDIGIAEVQGTINGCPTQLIVIHAAGYVPPNYKQSDIDSWKKSLDGLNGIRGGWADLKNNTKFYESNKADVDRINDIIATRISRINSIYTTMSANKWLGSEQNQWIKEDTDLYNEQEALANKLNGK
jgi:signal peptidase I